MTSGWGRFDQNNHSSIFAVSNDGFSTPVELWADPTTHALVVGATLSASSLAINDGTTTTRKASVLGLTDSNPLTVAVVNGTGDQITSFGGGTQYQELATTSPATGTLFLGRYQTSFPTLTNGQMNEPMLDSSSRLILGSSSATIGAVSNTSFVVTQSTAANFNATVIGTGTFAVQAAQSGSWTSGTTSATVNVGQQTVNTTAVQISSTSTVPTNGIMVQALSTNGAVVFVGGSGVTISNGFELQPGQSIPFTCNLNTLYIISAASTTDKICYNVV